MMTTILGCNDDQDRFERIDRLRILGTEKTPSIASFNDSSVTLTWIVATPNKTDAPVATNTLDTTSPLALPLELTNITTAKTSFETLDIHRVTTTVNFPNAYLLPLGQSGEQRYRVSLSVNQGDETIQAVGDIIRFPSSDQTLDLVSQEPLAAILQPSETDTYDISEELALECDSPIKTNENFKISWYSTAGKIDNFRACETIMDVSFAKKGETHTFIQCVRGAKTRSTLCDVKDIVFN